MKAIVYTQYGPPDVLQLQEIEKPVPKDNEVLVKVHASSVNAVEWRRFTLPRIMLPMFGRGLREPKDKSIGADFAGEVEAVGTAIKGFRPGDEVFGVHKGAYAEYVCAPENHLAPKPANVSFEAAAVIIKRIAFLFGVKETKVEAMRTLWNVAREAKELFVVDERANVLLKAVREVNAEDPGEIIGTVQDGRLVLAVMGAVFPIYNKFTSEPARLDGSHQTNANTMQHWQKPILRKELSLSLKLRIKRRSRACKWQFGLIPV